MLCGCLAWTGLLLYRHARHANRLDRHLVCARCSHDLHGKPWETQHCPECGNPLTDPSHLRVGNRAPKPALLTAGLVLLIVPSLFAATSVAGYVSGLDWQKEKPVFLLRYEAFNGGDRSRQAAFDELYRRYVAQQVSPLAVSQLIPDLLARHADTSKPWREAYGDMLQRLRQVGEVSDIQWTAYAGRYLTASAHVAGLIQATGPDDAGLPAALIELSLLPRGGYADAFLLQADAQLLTMPAGESARPPEGIVLARAVFSPLLSPPPISPATATTAYNTLAVPMSSLPTDPQATLALRVKLRLLDAARFAAGKSPDVRVESGGALVAEQFANSRVTVSQLAVLTPSAPAAGIADTVFFDHPPYTTRGPSGGTQLLLPLSLSSILPRDTEVDLSLRFAAPSTLPEMPLGRAAELSIFTAASPTSPSSVPPSSPSSFPTSSPTTRGATTGGSPGAFATAVSTFRLPPECPLGPGRVDTPPGTRLVVRPIATVPAGRVTDPAAYLPRELDLTAPALPPLPRLPATAPTRVP